MRRSLLNKLHSLIRILQLIATFKIDHNFSCEVIYVPVTATVLVMLTFFALKWKLALLFCLHTAPAIYVGILCIERPCKLINDIFKMLVASTITMHGPLNIDACLVTPVIL